MSKITEIEKKVCPPHEFQAVKYQEQEAVTAHYNYKDHLIATLVHERVKLFCIKCGEIKNIKATKFNHTSV